MNSPLKSVETIELVLREYMASMLVADDEALIAPENVKMYMQHRLEFLAHQLTAVLRLPSVVLQDDREVYRFPATRKDRLLDFFGWGRWARYTVVRVNELITFPGIPVPKLKSPMRVVFTTTTGPGYANR